MHIHVIGWRPKFIFGASEAGLDLAPGDVDKERLRREQPNARGR